MCPGQIRHPHRKKPIKINEAAFDRGLFSLKAFEANSALLGLLGPAIVLVDTNSRHRRVADTKGLALRGLRFRCVVTRDLAHVVLCKRVFHRPGLGLVDEIPCMGEIRRGRREHQGGSEDDFRGGLHR